MSYTLISSYGYAHVYELDKTLHGDLISICGRSGLDIDADGCPTAYAPPGSGLPALDVLRDGGLFDHNGKLLTWYQVTDTRGNWIIQGPQDPAPGYIVSSTSWGHPNMGALNQRKYVDANVVPYFVIPGRFPFRFGTVAMLGVIGTVYYIKTKVTHHCVFADGGPHNAFGEGSIALARALGIDCSPTHGGVGNGVISVFYPEHKLTFGDWDGIQGAGEILFQQWGGPNKLQEVVNVLFS